MYLVTFQHWTILTKLLMKSFLKVLSFRLFKSTLTAFVGVKCRSMRQHEFGCKHNCADQFRQKRSAILYIAFTHRRDKISLTVLASLCSTSICNTVGFLKKHLFLHNSSFWHVEFSVHICIFTLKKDEIMFIFVTQLLQLT